MCLVSGYWLSVVTLDASGGQGTKHETGSVSLLLVSVRSVPS